MKRALLAVALFAPAVHAQVTTRWSNTQPAPSVPIQTFAGTHLALGAGQDAYVAGTGIAASPNVVRLARIAPDGTTVWSVNAPLPAAVDVLGLVVSQQDGSATIGLGGIGGLACMKFDAAGNHLWTSNVYNGPLAIWSRAGRSIAVDAAGNLYLCGSTVTGPNLTLDWDAAVVSFDPLGNLRFATLVPGPLGRQDQATFVRADASGVLVAGTFDGDDEFAGRSTFLARVSSNGTVAALHTHAASPQNFVKLLGADLDDQDRVQLLRRLGPTSTSVTATDLARYDASDLPVSSVPFDYTVARPVSFDVLGDGSAIVCGFMNSAGFPGFVARFDGAQQLVAQTFLSLGGASQHYLEHVVAESNGDATISGFVTTPDGGVGSVSVPIVYRVDAGLNTRWTSMDPLGSYTGQPGRPVSDDSGRTWVSILRSPGSFYRVETRALQPQSQSLCHGDASSASCPCGNSSGALAQAGCANSTGGVGKLVDAGSASIANDSLVFTCSGLDQTTIALLVEATNVTQPIGFGDGLRCFGGTLARMSVRAASNGTVVFPSGGDPSIFARSSALGGTIVPGSRRLYQVYYRDVSASFCPSPTGGTFNFSNALLVSWGS